MLFLLHGEDPFRTRLRVVELVRSLVAGGDGGAAGGDLAALTSPALGAMVGVTRYDAGLKPFDAAAITLSGRSQGLFDTPGEHRVVVVDHAEALPNASFLDGFPPEAALILVAHEGIAAPHHRRAPARGKAQAAKVSPFALSEAVVAAGGRVERIAPLEHVALRQWISARAALRGATLSPEALTELETLGPDTDRLEQELGKLAAYAAGALITVEDVHRLVSGAIDLDIFKLTKAVVERNTHVAIGTLERLLADGQAVQQILALLLWQFRVLLFAVQLDRPPSKDGGRPDVEKMAKAIRSSPGAILRLRAAARGVRRADITRAYESLYATDVAIKSGRVDSEMAAITLCVLDLCGVQNARATDLLEIPMSRR